MTSPVVPIPQGATIGAPGSAPESQPNPAPQTSIVPIPEGATGPGVRHAQALNPNPPQNTEPDNWSNFDPNQPLTSYGAATRAGLGGLARDTVGAVKGAAAALNPKPQNEHEVEAFKVAGVGGMLAHRLIVGFGSVMKPHEIAAAIHDINNSPDPTGTYLKIAQKTASEGAGQAVTALATEGAVKTAGAGVRVAGEMLDKGETAAETSKPSLAQKVIKGKNVEQEPAQTALKQAAGTDEPSLQETLTKPIEDNQAKADALYDEMDKTGVDVKNLTQKLRNTERKLTQLTDTPEDQALETKLIDSREGLIQKIKDSGVSEDQINEADTQFQKTKALSDINSRVFKNPSVVEGDVEHGTPETVNVDSTIKALKKLENTKYGNRVEQAFGPDGAKQLFDKLYEAQRMGVHAMKYQTVASWLGKVAVGAGLVEGANKLIGAVSSHE